MRSLCLPSVVKIRQSLTYKQEWYLLLGVILSESRIDSSDLVSLRYPITITQLAQEKISSDMIGGISVYRSSDDYRISCLMQKRIIRAYLDFRLQICRLLLRKIKHCHSKVTSTRILHYMLRMNMSLTHCTY